MKKLLETAQPAGIRSTHQIEVEATKKSCDKG
jgi:hypothetical protein